MSERDRQSSAPSHSAGRIASRLQEVISCKAVPVTYKGSSVLSAITVGQGKREEKGVCVKEGAASLRYLVDGSHPHCIGCVKDFDGIGLWCNAVDKCLQLLLKRKTKTKRFSFLPD